MGEAVQDERVVPRRLARQLDRAETRQQLLERHLGLEPRQGCSDAEVDSPPEGDMASRLTMVAIQPELVGIGLKARREEKLMIRPPGEGG